MLRLMVSFLVLAATVATGQERLTLGGRVAGQKALTDNLATLLMDVAVNQAEGFGGRIGYFVKCGNVTNVAEQSGSVTIACHNLLGTTSCGFGTPDGVTLGDGTASIDAPVFSAVAKTEAVAISLQSNCTGVTPTFMLARWWLEGSPTVVTQR